MAIVQDKHECLEKASLLAKDKAGDFYSSTSL